MRLQYQQQTKTKIMNRLQVQTSLNKIYSDIEDQLCNRHTVVLSRIKHKFENLYSGNKPMWYVIGKGLCQFGLEQQPGKDICKEIYNKQINNFSNLSMSVQNGVVIAMAKTQVQENIYINYNKWEQQAEHCTQNTQFQDLQQTNQQLILTYKGQVLQKVCLSQQTHQLTNQITQLYKLAIQDISLIKIAGGIIYIDSRLYGNDLYQRQALLVAFYVSILQVNQILQQYTVGDIRDKLGNWAKGSLANIVDRQRMLRYLSILQYGSSSQDVGADLISISQISKNNKFIVTKLLKPLDIKQNKITEHQNKLLKMFHNQQISIQDVLASNKKYYMQQIGKEHQQDQIYACLYDIVHQNQQSIQGFIINADLQYVVLYADSRLISQLTRRLSHQLKKLIASTKTSGQQLEQLGKDILQKYNKNGIIQGKWVRSTNTDGLVFSSLPSPGISVLDPKEQIWFIQ